MLLILLSGASIEITPKALANFSPGLERSDNPGDHQLIFVQP
jgi:hypothetical protein